MKVHNLSPGQKLRAIGPVTLGELPAIPADPFAAMSVIVVTLAGRLASFPSVAELASLKVNAERARRGLEVAQHWHPTTFHALGYSALASETLREALLRVVRYGRVVTTGARLELEQSGDEVVLRLRSLLPGTQFVPASVDAGVASVVILCRAGRGEPIDPVRVSLGRVEPGCSSRKIAMSRSGWTASTRATRGRPPASMTETDKASWTTWKAVAIFPSLLTAKPVPTSPCTVG